MKKFTIYHLVFLILSTVSFAQVGVGTTSPLASSALDVTATNKGLLVPRVALTGSTDTATIASPATSLLVYNTATAGTSPNNVIPGYYYYTGTKWERLTNGGANSVGAFTTATANGATITGGVLQLAPASVTTGGIVNTLAQTFDGTKTFNVDAIVNGLTVGKGAGNVATNSAFGSGALLSVNQNNIDSNSTRNSAFGFQALNLLTTGTNNNAFGSGALQKTTTGKQNIAMGTNSLNTNTTGSFNVGIGHNSLNLTDGTGTTPIANNGGSANVAIGSGALSANSTGAFNTAVGFSSGSTNSTGYKNTVIGANTGFSATNLNNATAIGFGAIATANNSIQLGNADVTNVNTSGTITAGAITYPNVGGATGQVLTTNGSVASWTNNTSTSPSITNDNSNNVTGYPTWVTGATTGNLPLKISSSKFTFNPSTGDATINGLTIGLGKNSYATNTVFGVNALSLLSNSTAIRNTAIGANTLSGLYLNPDNTAIGYNALLTTQGYQNTAIGSGADALYAVFNCTAIGYGASGSTSNTMQLGNSAVTDIYGGAPTGGAGTGANFRGKAFIVNSDARIKKDIVNSKYGLATILKLRPVNYTLINDVKHETQVGFIAQEVKEIVPEMVTGKEGDLSKGEILGVNYGGLVPILTKAIQELKKENELQEIEINQLKELVKSLINKK